MNIVLTGSLGNISKPLATELIAKGHLVTIISSKDDKQKDIEALGAKAAIGSIKDIAFLTATFTGADIVYCMEPPIDQSRLFNPSYTVTEMLNEMDNIAGNYKHAILKSGVKKVIHLSSIGAHTDKGNGILKFHYYAEKVLNQLPAHVSIKFMRPVGFYYNLLANAQMIKQLSKGFVGAFMALRYYGLGGLLSGKRGVIVSNVGDNDINLMVSPFDIASVIAEEMEQPFNGRTFRYIASEELTCNETAKILGEAIDKPYLKWGRISDKQLFKAMVGMKMSPTWVQGFVEMQASGRGKNCRLYEDYYRHRPVLGKTKLKDFAEEFAKAYNQD
ncbi:MAG: NAD-dependent dehydratase [Cytophagales bacterium CG18_big_fil_WC_8_21_14_2_50_42_9]|nr:MAG: NAD-dependent dehydratase [Cytophagales bacterium CG18_big_fil_WC_8_21_14_2_50_42_9]